MLTTSIETKKDAVLFIESLANEDRSFHFDDPVAEIINGHTKQPLFTPEEVPVVEAAVKQCFALLDDPFTVCIAADAIARKDTPLDYFEAEAIPVPLSAFYEQETFPETNFDADAIRTYEKYMEVYGHLF